MSHISLQIISEGPNYRFKLIVYGFNIIMQFLMRILSMQCLLKGALQYENMTSNTHIVFSHPLPRDVQGNKSAKLWLPLPGKERGNYKFYAAEQRAKLARFLAGCGCNCTFVGTKCVWASHAEMLPTPLAVIPSHEKRMCHKNKLHSSIHAVLHTYRVII